MRRPRCFHGPPRVYGEPETPNPNSTRGVDETMDKTKAIAKTFDAVADIAAAVKPTPFPYTHVDGQMPPVAGQDTLVVLMKARGRTAMVELDRAIEVLDDGLRGARK